MEFFTDGLWPLWLLGWESDSGWFARLWVISTTGGLFCLLLAAGLGVVERWRAYRWRRWQRRHWPKYRR